MNKYTDSEQVERDIEALEEALEALRTGGFGAKREVAEAARVVIDTLREAAGLTMRSGSV